jgi:photosystem II stability/assembly factor-like uncharacterized protein
MLSVRFLVAASLCTALLAAQTGKPRWDTQQSGVTDDLHAVSFVSAKTGWAAGDHNVVIKTSDGGATWKLLTERQALNKFTSVDFVDESEGWAQSMSVLLHTTDGGESWQPANQLPGGGFGGACMVAKVRYQLKVHGTGNKVYRTSDGGNTWQELPSPLPRNDYIAIFFADPMHGWVSGDNGRFARTEDGGQTWKPVEGLQGNLTRMQFLTLTPERGWLLPWYGKGGPMVSSDGGATWTNQNARIPTFDPMEDLHFLSHNDGVLLTDKAVYRTSNGGKNWKTIGKLAGFRALSFPSADEGWLVGKQGAISHYHLVLEK